MLSGLFSGHDGDFLCRKTLYKITNKQIIYDILRMYINFQNEIFEVQE